jgi:hypothetical protein
MDYCLIDDRRIHVDFSQSVSSLWGQFRQSKRNANKVACLDHVFFSMTLFYFLQNILFMADKATCTTTPWTVDI